MCFKRFGEPLGKMLVRGMYKQSANAAWENNILKKELTRLVLKELETESSHLCSKKDLLSFGIEKLTVEIQERAPLFHSILLAASVNSKSKAKNPSPQAEFGAIGKAAAVCVCHRLQYMITVQLLITDFLYHSNWLVSN